MKTPYRILIPIVGLLCASMGGAFSQDQKPDQPDKKPQRPPAEKKADPPRKPEPKKPDAQPVRGPQGPSSEQIGEIREEMRKTAGEIQKLRQAGKHDEAEKKMAEVRKKFEGLREKFGGGDRGRGGPLPFGQRGPGQGKGGPPFTRKGPDAVAPDQVKPAPQKPAAKPSAEPQKQAAKPAERKGPPHHPEAGKPSHHADGPGPRKPGSRDHDGRPNFAQGHHWQDRGRGFRPPGGSPFAQGPGSFQRGPGGPQMMKFRMMQMRRMAMMAGAGKGPSSFRGPGNWGRSGPFAGNAPGGPQSKLQWFQAKRAGALKAEADRKNKPESKRSKGDKPGKGDKKRNKKSAKPACAECAKAKKGS